MPMDFRYSLAFLPIMLLFSCAQVGQISGGEKDIIAPEPVRTIPENKTLFFSSQSIRLIFDEFITLNNPQQNIFIVPSDTKLNASLRKKELILSWNEELKPNTTYVIYFNEAIKDVTEKNTRLFTYVFSTGMQIDTLQQELLIRDAMNGQVVSGATIGFFESKDSVKPIYFSSSDALGRASMKYLKQGRYYLRAFKDENKNLITDEREMIGFLNDSIEIDSVNKDTLIIQLFQPEAEQSITNFEPQGPESFLVSLSKASLGPVIYLNDLALDSTRIRKIDETHFKLFPIQKAGGDYKVVFIDKNERDSSSLRTSEKDWLIPLKLTPELKNDKIITAGSISFLVNGLLNSVDTSKIAVYSELDTAIRINYDFYFAQDILRINPVELARGRIVFKFLPGALVSKGGSLSESFTESFLFKSIEDLGVLHVSPNGFSGPLILELIKNKAVIAQIRSLTGDNLTFTNILPGEYQLRVVEDENGNGKWDTGNERLGIQPEKVFLFSKPTKVRPNWEYDLKINPSGNYE